MKHYELQPKEKYVVTCINAVKSEDVLLGLNNCFEPGDFVSKKGFPTKDIYNAALYEKDVNDFPFDIFLGNGINLKKYFHATPVEVKIQICLKK